MIHKTGNEAIHRTLRRCFTAGLVCKSAITLAFIIFLSPSILHARVWVFLGGSGTAAVNASNLAGNVEIQMGNFSIDADLGNYFWPPDMNYSFAGAGIRVYTHDRESSPFASIKFSPVVFMNYWSMGGIRMDENPVSAVSYMLGYRWLFDNPLSDRYSEPKFFISLGAGAMNVFTNYDIYVSPMADNIVQVDNGLRFAVELRIGTGLMFESREEARERGVKEEPKMETAAPVEAKKAKPAAPVKEKADIKISDSINAAFQISATTTVKPEVNLHDASVAKELVPEMTPNMNGLYQNPDYKKSYTGQTDRKY